MERKIEHSDITQLVKTLPTLSINNWMMPEVIAFFGYKGSGKTLAALILEQWLALQGAKVKHLNFADPLKEVLSQLLGLTESNKEDTIELLRDFGSDIPTPTYRHALTSFGTGWGRKMMHPDIWCRIWEKRAIDFLEKDLVTSVVLVSDLRHDNELKIIKKRGGVCLFIDNPKADPRSPGSIPKFLSLLLKGEKSPYYIHESERIERWIPKAMHVKNCGNDLEKFALELINKVNMRVMMSSDLKYRI